MNKAGLFATGLVLGLMPAACGYISPPIPETKIHTVTLRPPAKIITHEEVQTVYETVPLPDSCYTAVEMIQRVVNSSSAVTRDASSLQTALSDLQVAEYSDPKKANALYLVLFDASEQLDDDLGPALEDNERIAVQLDSCKQDIEEN